MWKKIIKKLEYNINHLHSSNQLNFNDDLILFLKSTLSIHNKTDLKKIHYLGSLRTKLLDKWEIITAIKENKQNANC